MLLLMNRQKQEQDLILLQNSAKIEKLFVNGEMTVKYRAQLQWRTTNGREYRFYM